MNLLISNHHIILPLETSRGIKHALLDTGHPGFTFFDDPSVNSILLFNRVYPINRNFIYNQLSQSFDWEKLSEFAGTTVNGLIGHDIISTFDLTIDFHRSILSVSDGPEDFQCVNLQLYFNCPVIQIGVNNLELPVLLDTGCVHTVIDCTYKNHLKPRNQIFREYSPLLGYFDAELYEADVKIGSYLSKNATIVCAPEYNTLLGPLKWRNVVGILGMTAVSDQTIYISYQKQLFGIRSSSSIAE